MNASRQSFIVSAVISTLLAALFVARLRLAPYAVESPFEGGMPLAATLTRLTVAWPWVAAALAALIVGWTLLIVVQLTVKYTTVANRNYLPAQIFLVASGGLVVSGEALASLISAWLLTLASRQLVFSFHKKYRFGELFHAGLYLGAIPLLYAPAAVIVVPAAIAALAIYRRSGRESVVCLTGLFFPVPAAGFIHWALGDGGEFIYRELWRCAVDTSFDWSVVPFSAAVPAVPVLILSLFAVVWSLGRRKSDRKTHSKFMQHTSLLLLLTAVSSLVPGTSTTLVALVAVPCALTVPDAFSGKASTLSTVLYIIILISVLAIDLTPIAGISLP